MGWLRRLIHRLMGSDRYHDQAGEVQAQILRADLLEKRLQVFQRRHPQ